MKFCFSEMATNCIPVITLICCLTATILSQSPDQPGSDAKEIEIHGYQPPSTFTQSTKYIPKYYPLESEKYCYLAEKKLKRLSKEQRSGRRAYRFIRFGKRDGNAVTPNKMLVNYKKYTEFDNDPLITINFIN